VSQGRIRFVITAAVAAALATACFAQALPDVSNASAPPLHTPGHALIDGPHETVNPANGQLSLRFAVPLPPGRQLTPQFSIAYDSGSSTTFFGPTPQVWPASGALFQRGWSYTAPMLTNVRAQQDAGDSGLCDFSTSYVLQTDDGGRHEFGLSIAGYDKAPPVGYPDPCQGQTQVTSQQTPDGWSASVSPDNPDSSFMNHASTLVDPDGTTYTFGENAAHDAFASGFPITVGLSGISYAPDGDLQNSTDSVNGAIPRIFTGAAPIRRPAHLALMAFSALSGQTTRSISVLASTAQTVCHTDAQAPSQPTKSSPSSGTSGGGNLLDVAYHPRRKLRGQRVDKVLEHWLSGIDVYATTVPEVVAAFGQPSSFQELTEKQVGNTGPVGSGERVFDWRSHGLKMEVSVGYYTDQKSHSVVESYVQTVDVRGSKPIGKMGVTRAGLKLGDTYADAVRIYGHAEKGPVGFAVNFADGTFLAADTDQFGRINHLHLDTNPD